MSVHLIHDLVRTGQATPEQGALLLQLRRDIERARRPWWHKAAVFIGRMLLD